MPTSPFPFPADADRAQIQAAAADVAVFRLDPDNSPWPAKATCLTPKAQADGKSRR